MIIFLSNFIFYFLQSHRDAKGLYRKSFPLYDTFEEIYAKDRANGVSAASAADRLEKEMNQSNASESSPMVCNVRCQTSETKKTKRKFEDIEKTQEQFKSMMQKIMQHDQEIMKELANTLSKDEKSDRARL